MDANARHAANGDQKHNLAATMALDLPSGMFVSLEVDSLMVGLQSSSEKESCQSFEVAIQGFSSQAPGLVQRHLRRVKANVTFDPKTAKFVQFDYDYDYDYV
jgi:hypothetical protein